MNVEEFAKRHRIRMSCRPAARNPHMEGMGMRHWRCALSHAGKRMTVTFSMGSGLGGRQPDVGMVLDSLASDASGYENARDFEDWMSEYGFGDDRRRAQRTFRAVKSQAASLKRILGSDLYEKLLYETERL